MFWEKGSTIKGKNLLPNVDPLLEGSKTILTELFPLEMYSPFKLCYYIIPTENSN